MDGVKDIERKQRAKGNRFQPQNEMYLRDNRGYNREGRYQK